MSKPNFVWSIYFPAPQTKRWRVRGIDVDGERGLEVEVVMSCNELRHSPRLNLCRVCRQHHELPKATDERYAYRWYPMKPSISAVVQWNRRYWEKWREANQEVGDE